MTQVHGDGVTINLDKIDDIINKRLKFSKEDID